MISIKIIYSRTYLLRIIVFSLVMLFQFYSANAQGEEKVFKAAVDGDGVQRVEVIGGSYYFDPNHIIVKVNVPVELTFKKEPGFVPHNIKIIAPEAGININEEMSSDPKTVRFTPVKAGRYSIYCDKSILFLKSHREKGMEGVLEVVD